MVMRRTGGSVNGREGGRRGRWRTRGTPRSLRREVDSGRLGPCDEWVQREEHVHVDMFSTLGLRQQQDCR